MNSAEVAPSNLMEVFGIEIRQVTTERSEMRQDSSARETLENLELAGDHESALALVHAVDQVNKLIKITRHTDDQTEELIDIFAAPQIVDMADRIQQYLGTNTDDYTSNNRKPADYTFFVDRLSMYLRSYDSYSDRFGRFERHHADPSINTTGPQEANSRGYANEASEVILRNLQSFYNTGFDIQLLGPTKMDNGNLVWGRGIAECQFLILDYTAVQVAKGFDYNVRLPQSEVTMTIQDIAANIASLLTQRRHINSRVRQINQFIAEDVDDNIGQLAELTQEVLYRGRWGIPQYEREPRQAQRRIFNIKSLLLQAISLEQVRAQEEEIPVLEPDSLLEE